MQFESNNIIHLDYDAKKLISYNILDTEDIKKILKRIDIMKRQIGLLLAAVMVLNTTSSIAFGFTNPLKSYNLYEDTHPSVSSGSDGTRETVMDEYYQNSLSSSKSELDEVPSESLEEYDPLNPQKVEIPRRRNDALRESARKVYSNPETPAAWLKGPYYYQNPSFDSIKEKYKRSNFAGCLQECEAYVRLNPNDTLGFYYLAMCYTKVNDKENAIKAYEKVISLNDNPMIVKYATNGRNCVMGIDEEKCYPNVNEPELIYPYADMAKNMDLTPVDPETLVNRNIKTLQNKLSPVVKEDNNNGNNNSDPNNQEKNKKINLPFGNQDEKLDNFINAPYGNGLSPELNKEYKQLQLKKIQQTINNAQENPESDGLNIKNIKLFDNQKSDSDTIKLAYITPADMESLSKDPEFVKSQKEYEELRMLLGSDSQKNSENDLTNLLPELSNSESKVSPEVIQTMMIQSMMQNF